VGEQRDIHTKRWKRANTEKPGRQIEGSRASPSETSSVWISSYEVVTVNGITEIIEHRKMEPLFYVTDDAAVWEELGQK
jgi:hypothetical protein